MKIVIKIGTNILTTPKNKLDLNNLRNLIQQLSTEKKAKNIEFIIVSSGAITCGAEKLKLSTTKTIADKQAAASVGQYLLMKEYGLFFGEFGINIGQILLTKNGLTEEKYKQNAKTTIQTLLKKKILPIINENDSVATDEIGINFGDNDNLSSQVAQLINAKKLIILTDTDGLYTDNPKENKKAHLIHKVKEVDEKIIKLANDTISNKKSKGGMTSKIKAAKEASESGIEVTIANGRQDDILHQILDQKKSVGTTFLPQKKKG